MYHLFSSREKEIQAHKGGIIIFIFRIGDWRTSTVYGQRYEDYRALTSW